MATKLELKQQIISLYIEYTGFGVDGVNGLSGMSKAQLENEIVEIKRALRFKRYAAKINVDRLKGYFALPESEMGKLHRRRQIIEAMANELWHKGSYELAKAKVRKQFS